MECNWEDGECEEHQCEKAQANMWADGAKVIRGCCPPHKLPAARQHGEAHERGMPRM